MQEALAQRQRVPSRIKPNIGENKSHQLVFKGRIGLFGVYNWLRFC